MFFWVPSWTYIQESMLLSKPEQLSLKEAHTISKLGCQVGLWIPWFLAASGWARPGPKPQSTSIKGQSITRAGLQPRQIPVPGGQCRSWLQSQKNISPQPGDTEPGARVRGGPGGGDRSPKTLKMYICHVPEVLWPKAGLAGLRLDCMLTSNPNLRSASAGWVAMLVTCPHEPHLHHSYHTD